MSNFNKEALRQLKDIAESSQLNWKGWKIGERIASADYFCLYLDADSCNSNLYLNGSETEVARVSLMASAEIIVYFLGENEDKLLPSPHYQVTVRLDISPKCSDDVVFAKVITVDCLDLEETRQLVIDMLACPSIEEAQAHAMRQMNNKCIVY